MPHSEIAILLGSDDTYARPLSATIHSVMDHAADADRFHFYVLAAMGDLALERLEKSLTGVHTTFVDINPHILAKLPGASSTVTHVSQAMWLRVFAESILPSTVDRFIYLDSDVLAQADLADLWDTPLCQTGVAAVRNRFWDSTDNVNVAGTFERAGLGTISETSPDAEYFNSGVMLADLQYWRSHHVQANTLGVIRKYGDLLQHPDQDALNIVFHDSWTRLDTKWNNTYVSRLARTASVEDIVRAELDSCSIAHFTSAHKPWHADYPDGIAKQLWKHYDDMGDWKHDPLDSPVRS